MKSSYIYKELGASLERKASGSVRLSSLNRNARQPQTTFRRPLPHPHVNKQREEIHNNPRELKKEKKKFSLTIQRA